MKKIGTLVAALLLTIATMLPASVALALGDNMIPNPSLETASGNSPAQWHTDSWGSNNATFTYENTGHTGNRSATVSLANYQSGDAKWYFTPVTVAANTKYTVSDWYKSSVASGMDAVITTTAGKTTYKWLADLPASSSWKQASATFTTPKNAKTITLIHYIGANGSLTTDDYGLATTNGTPTTPTDPTPPTVPTAPAVQFTTPLNNTTVSGTQELRATATDQQGIASVQFKLDGTNLGATDTTAPYALNWDTTSASNAAHVLTAIATNTSGLSTTAQVTVTVNNSVTPPAEPPAVPDSANLLANPSVENAANGKPTSWISDGWGTNTRSLTYENTGHTGSHSVKTTVTNYKSGDAKWYFADVPVTAGKTYAYNNWYKSTVATELDAMVTLNNGTVQYYWLGDVPVSSNWAQAKAQFSAPANAKSVSIFQVLAKNGTVQTDDFSLTEYTPTQFNRALASLTFDDAWRNIYTNGLPLLQKYNMPSTQYLLTLPTIDGYPDYMTLAMMRAFQTQGSEIASHTVDHADLTTLNVSQIDAQLADSQSQLRTWMGSSAAANFATPYGAYNPTVVNEIKKYYRSHRSVESGYNSKDNFDIYNIKVQNITNTTTPADVQAWVSHAMATKTWLVLVYHEVATNPEDSTYAVTPANLDAELNAIKQSGITVKTVNQALDEIQAQL